MRAAFRTAAAVGGLLCLACASPVRAEEPAPDTKKCVADGLKWMVSQQQPDGHWEAFGGQYPITMTALGGMSLLMEGSTLREGKYKKNIRLATDFLMKKAQATTGQLFDPNIPGEAGRYMYGHGFALMFLSCVYGEEDDPDKRKKMEEVLVAAAKFSREAQTRRESTKYKDGDGKFLKLGGWGYLSAKEGNNFDEGSVTITQMQGLRAARNAGIAVPVEAIKEGINYLRETTNPQGGVVYSLGGGGGSDGRPALTAAAIACGFSAGDYNSPIVKQWFKFCQKSVPQLGGGRFGHDEYTHYYYAQAMYILGDDGWAKLFPDSKPEDRMTWSKYRKETFENLKRSQGADGSWTGGHVGPVFITAVHLTILQLDNAAVPLYQR